MRALYEILSAQLRIEGKLDELKHELRSFRQSQNTQWSNERESNMATRQTLDTMNTNVTANTNAALAAKAALEHFAASTADLTKALQDAIASGADDAEVKAAADAIAQNTATLQASIPQTAQAIVANTGAAGDAAAVQG